MAQLFANNISTTLASAALLTDLVLQIASAAGLPAPGTTDWFYATLATPTNPETAWEIVKCTGVSGTTITVVRAQGGTTALGWAAGTTVELRPCSPAMIDMMGAGLTLALASPPAIGGTAPAAVTALTLKETSVALSGASIDLSTGNVFSKAITAATTFALTNVPASGTAVCFILDLTNGGAYTVTWWGVKWASGTAPTLTASGRDVLGFITHDGGTTWSGFVLGQAMA
jgi:hypothetical protein